MEKLAEWTKTPITVSIYDPVHKRVVADHTIPHVFPEDNLLDFREKIHVATGIPLYRQHLTDGETTYSLWTNTLYPIDAGVIKSNILIDNVDEELYRTRNELRVEIGDIFQLMAIRKKQWRLIDLAQFVQNTDARELLNDKYTFDKVYWGFIIKYWPILTPDAFAAYLRDASVMPHAYPDIAGIKSVLAAKFAAEKNIVLAKYKNARRASTLSYSVSITHFIAYVSTISTNLNIRNIFEQSRVSDAIPEIRAYLADGMMVQRRHVNAPQVDFPSVEAFRTGIVFAIDFGGSGYLWLAVHPNGRYYMRSTFSERLGTSFDDIYDILRTYVRPIIAEINTLGRVAFVFGNGLELISREALVYRGLNIALLWQKALSMGAFKKLMSAWDKYAAAGIVTLKPTTLPDRIDMLFRKGMYDYDPMQIDRLIDTSGGSAARNQYSYMSNPTTHARFVSLYGGRSMSMMLRDADVRVDVADIREDEYDTFLEYVLTQIWSAQDSLGADDGESKRRLQRLRERDPALYNLSRYDSDRNYSKICQGTRQPTIFDRSEVSTMSATARKKLTEYWNFSKNEPAWYGCPDKGHPHLGFVTGVHPRKWCLPCCNKRLRDNEVVETCLTEREYAGESESSRHVMVYGKEVPPDRFSAMRADVGLFDKRYLLAGTAPQSAIVSFNTIYAIVAAGYDRNDLVKVLTPTMYDMVIDMCAGRDRALVIADLLGSPSTAAVDWDELLPRLMYAAHGISIVKFIDNGAVDVVIPQTVVDGGADAFMFVFQTPRGNCYPVALDNKYVFGVENSAVRSILSAIDRGETVEFDLKFASNIDDHKVVVKHVNLRALCYAVEMNSSVGRTYMTIQYSAQKPDGVPIDPNGLLPSEKLTYDAATHLIGKLRLDVAHIHACDGYRIIEMSNGYSCYVTVGGPSGEPLNFDPLALNRAILARQAPTTTGVNEALYRSSIHNLILMTLGEIFDKERNADMRKRIMAAVKSRDAMDALEGELAPVDMSIIRATLRYAGVKGLQRRMDHSFDFDKLSLHKIQSVSREEARKMVFDLLEGHYVAGDVPSGEFPNMYTTCRINDKQPFCRDGKLIVADTSIDVIVDDLRNPVLAEAIFAEIWSNTIVDQLMFTSHGDDKITVHK